MNLKKTGRGRYLHDYYDEHGERRRWTIKAATQEAAERTAFEVELDVSRRKRGLAPEAPNPQGLTVGDLCKWWREGPCKRLAHPKRTATVLTSMVENRAIAKKRADLLTPADVDAMLADLEDEQIQYKSDAAPHRRYAPRSLNHARTTLRTVFSRAIQAQKVRLATNPVAGSETREVAQSDLVTLTHKEVTRLLAVVEDPTRAIYAVAVFAGLRRGEIWALRRDAIDLERGTIKVSASNHRASTKTGRVRVVPIHAELRPHLARQMLSHKLALVFPSPLTGKMRSADAKASRDLQAALERAGVKRHLRFHDLRHTCATLFIQAGVGLPVLQRILGHASITMTVNTYGHLVVDDMAREMSRLIIGGVQNETGPQTFVAAEPAKTTGGAR